MYIGTAGSAPLRLVNNGFGEKSFSASVLFLSTLVGTKRCPGQVGGGWEEMDSSNGSSHNSSQGLAANGQASFGRSSKSGGTGSQSAGSRESSGDLSERWAAGYASWLFYGVWFPLCCSTSLI